MLLALPSECDFQQVGIQPDRGDLLQRFYAAVQRQLHRTAIGHGAADRYIHQQGNLPGRVTEQSIRNLRTTRAQSQVTDICGATTRAGSLTSPLRDRFGIVQRLEFYNVKDLTECEGGLLYCR